MSLLTIFYALLFYVATLVMVGATNVGAAPNIFPYPLNKCQ